MGVMMILQPLLTAAYHPLRAAAYECLSRILTVTNGELSGDAESVASHDAVDKVSTPARATAYLRLHSNERYQPAGRSTAFSHSCQLSVSMMRIVKRASCSVCVRRVICPSGLILR
jgi:hypothetical protein